jgi:hypothetical protein
MLSPEFHENGVEAELQADPFRHCPEGLLQVWLCDQAHDVIEDDGFLLPALGLPCPPTKADGKLTRDKASHKKQREGNPLVIVGDSQGVVGLDEEEVEGQK